MKNVKLRMKNGSGLSKRSVLSTIQRLLTTTFLILTFSLFICSCVPFPDPDPEDGEGDTIISIKAIPGVTAPVTGAEPVTTITETEEYTGTVTWNGTPAVFAPNTIYTAIINLTPKGEYTLQGVTANFFTVAGATATNDADSGVVTAVFPKTGDATISMHAIPGVTPPEFGETPVTAIAATDQYTGTVTWSPNEFDASGGFKGETVYTATITLTAKTDYTLDRVPANFFTVARAETVTNAANSGVVTAVFQATLDHAPDPVDSAAIGGVTVPVTGETPVETITPTAQYTGTVTWHPEPELDKFFGETVYTATIYLTAERGYTFNGVAENFFTVAGATTVTNAADSGTVTAVFPATLPTVIDITAIQGVPAPVAGAKPVTAITETHQYTGTVAWSPPPVDNKFVHDTDYTATITVTPKHGYTLTGVTANSFTVAGTLTPATHAANSGVITAVFPKTGSIIIDIKAIPGVPAPVTGAAPVSTITETDQYTGTVTWTPSVTTFTHDTVYTAHITVTPKPTYTLEGVPANFFTVAGAASVTHAANSGAVTAVFPKTPEPFVIAGNYYTPGLYGNDPHACYWDNGQRYALPVPAGTTESQATAIAMDGNDIYIAGSYGVAGVPCYWKVSNGSTTRTDLAQPADFNFGIANAIAVTGGTVYAAGFCRTGGLHNGAFYWVGNTVAELPNPVPLGTAWANGIAIGGGKVYVAGYFSIGGGDNTACYWVDGILKENVRDASGVEEHSEAYAITVQGGKLYIAGYNNWFSHAAAYWEDNLGARHDMGAGEATAIAVDGTAVYVAGPSWYWANGTRTDLTGGYKVNGIAVVNGAVYAAGSYGDYDNHNACYWKDGTRTMLPGSGGSVATAIVQHGWSNVDTFVPVESITGVPASGFIGEPLTLTGTINPSNATNHSAITWALKSAGSTGATLSGSTLTATARGTVTVTARVANGRTAADDFVKDFEITITRNDPGWRSELVGSTADLGTDWYFGGTTEPAYPEKVWFHTTDDNYSLMQVKSAGQYSGSENYLLISREDKPAGEESSFVVEYVTNIEPTWDSDIGGFIDVYTLSGEQFTVTYTLAPGGGSINITDFDGVASMWGSYTQLMPEGVYAKQ